MHIAKDGMFATRKSLKKEFLKLLKEDEEFRYAVAGLIGLEEILKRIDRNTEAIKSLQEQVTRLQRQVEEHSKVIRALQEQVVKLQEQMVKHSKAIENLQKQMVKLQAHVNALGARYGVCTEEAFRESIKYLVEDLLGVYEVRKWTYYDEKGEVFGYPSIIDVDVLVKDDTHILIEYKAHVDRGDVAELYRIGKLYEKVTGKKPKLLLVAAVIRDRAYELAKKMGIEVRGYVYDKSGRMWPSKELKDACIE